VENDLYRGERKEQGVLKTFWLSRKVRNSPPYFLNSFSETSLGVAGSRPCLRDMFSSNSWSVHSLVREKIAGI